MATDVETRLKISAIDTSATAFRQVAQQIEQFTNRTGKAHRQLAESHKTAIAQITETGRQGIESLSKLGALVGVAIGVESLKEGVKEYARIDKGLIQLGITFGKSKEEMRAFDDEVEKAAMSAGINVDDMRVAFDRAARSMGSLDVARDLLPLIGRAASAMGSNVVDAQELITQSMRNFNVELRDAPKLVQALIAAQYKGRLSAAELAKAIGGLTENLSKEGETGVKGLSRAAVTLETIAVNAKDAEAATAGYAAILQSIGTRKMAPIFETLGIDLPATLADATAKGKSLVEAFVMASDQALRVRSEQLGTDPSKRMQYFNWLFRGEEARIAMQSILQHRDMFLAGMAKVDAAIAAGGKETDEAFRQTSESVTADLERLSNQWKETKEELGKDLVDVGAIQGLRWLGDEIKLMIKGFNDLSRAADWVLGKIRHPLTDAEKRPDLAAKGLLPGQPSTGRPLIPSEPGSATERTAREQLEATRRMERALELEHPGAEGGPALPVLGGGGRRPSRPGIPGTSAAPAPFGGGGRRPSAPGGSGTAIRRSKTDQSADAALIRKIAAEEGVDPDTAVAVARSEGLGTSWAGGDRGSSFGPLQAHFGGMAPGMMQKGQGDVMAAQGIDAKNPANKEAVLRWQLKYAKKRGWGEWYGAKRAGIGNRQGLDSPVRAAAPAPAIPSLAHPPMEPWKPEEEHSQLEEFRRKAAEPVRVKVAYDFDAADVRTHNKAYARRSFNKEARDSRYSSYSDLGTPA